MKWKRLSKPCALSTTRWRHTFSSLAATTGTYPIPKSGKRREMNGAVKLQHRLRTRVSRQFGRMGAVDGCGDEAVALTRRTRQSEYAVWEIHPVMKIAVND